MFEVTNIILTAIFVVVVTYLVYFVRLVKSYPRGPLPLPILGNVLLFRGSFNDPTIIYKLTDEWGKKYGPIYTIWAGHNPVVIVNNYELNVEASVTKRNDFIERALHWAFHEASRNGSQNIMSTNGPYWEALRKVSVFAIRRFMNSDRLSEIACEATDDAIALMVKEKKPFNPIDYIDFIVYNILAMMAFNTKFESITDQTFKEAKRMNTEFYEISGNGVITDYMPWLWPIYKNRDRKVREMTTESRESTKVMFNEHKQSYVQGVFRDFTDCVLEAKEEAIRENFDRSKFLNDDNLYNVVSDLFQAGTDTTQITLRWAFLILANDPQLQEQIHKEIKDNIGDRKPVQEDKDILPFTYAFVMEVLRLRPPVSLSMDHFTGVDTELGGHKISKGTLVLFNLYAQNTDPKYWSEPLKFMPQRFLDSDGKLLKGRLNSYVTFSLGRRACPGEKLALNNAFVIVAHFLQRVRLELPTGAGTADLEPRNMLIGTLPNNYEIKCHIR